MSRRPAKIELLFLYHLWACVPFALAWMLWPGELGELPAGDPRSTRLALVYGVAIGYLGLRTWVTSRGGGRLPLERLWPFLDVTLISLGLAVYEAPADSWAVLLYLLPVMQTAATLDLRWSLLVGGAAAVGYLLGAEQGSAEWWHKTAAQFRPFLLVLMASLLTHLAREVSRTRRELALAEYRNRLAAEMHDGIQHYLVGIAMRLELARSLLDSDPRRAAQIAVDQQHLVRQAGDELRMVVRRLRSAALDSAGLLEVLGHHAELFGQRTGLAVEVAVEGPPRALPPATEHALLRCVQEAMTNVVKHAEASRIDVRLTFGGAAVTCTVTDDGGGFDPSAEPAEATFGMETMRQRTAKVGGQCEWRSAPGAGSTVTFTVPAPSEEGGR